MTEEKEMRAFLEKKKKASKIPWYFFWLDYIQTNYFALESEEDTPLIRFNLLEEKWYIYEDRGTYRKSHKMKILKIFFDWAANEDPIFYVNTQQQNIALTQLAVKLQTDEVWDSGIFNGHRVENLINGLMDLETKEIFPHTPQYLSKRQIPRHYIPNTPIPPELERLYSATPDREKLHKWLVGMVHQRFDMELVLYLYGPPGSGKSPLLLMLEYMLGEESVSKTPMHKLGDKYGLKESYDKRLNTYPDLASKRITSDTVSIFKVIVGDIGGNIEVRLMYKDPFKYPVLCFHAYGSNQCSKFSKNLNEEVGSVMKRLCLCHYPVVQERDDEFKKSLQDPDLLDRIYSYLLDCIYEPLVTAENMEEWIRDNTERWFLDAEPVNRVVHELYEYNDDVLSVITRKGKNYGMPVYPSLLCHDVEREVREVLVDEGRSPAADLPADITEALKTMKIFREGKGAKGQYLKIRHRKEAEAMEENLAEAEEMVYYEEAQLEVFDPEPLVDKLLEAVKDWELWEIADLEPFASRQQIEMDDAKKVVYCAVRLGRVMMEGSLYRVRK